MVYFAVKIYTNLELLYNLTCYTSRVLIIKTELFVVAHQIIIS